MSEDLKSAEERWIERVGGSRVPLTPSVFPGDAVAIIYKPARMTSGKARTRQWKLRFEPRSSQYIEPLMAWTGRDDTLSQVELTFPSVEAAVAYARRQGLQFMVQGGAAAAASVRSMADSAPTGRRSSPAGPPAKTVRVGRADARTRHHSQWLGNGARCSCKLREAG
jgi:ETC complex I subunit conserved region